MAPGHLETIHKLPECCKADGGPVSGSPTPSRQPSSRVPRRLGFPSATWARHRLTRQMCSHLRHGLRSECDLLWEHVRDALFLLVSHVTKTAAQRDTAVNLPPRQPVHAGASHLTALYADDKCLLFYKVFYTKSLVLHVLTPSVTTEKQS